ncbi:MAG: helicase associated domain-containing protein, partial [Clostridia bacterium]|nr:helicase associated domain-containing protein [Clostridia bacterium]
KSLHSEKEVAEYSYRLIEEKLQLLEQPLDEYEVTLKLKSCLSTYLRNQFTDLQETTPTSELVTAIEAILKGMFYLPFAREIDEKRTEYASVRTRLARSFRVNENSNFEMYNFTMGNFPYLIKDNNNISQEFYDFICEYYNIDKVKFPPQVFVEMAEYFQFFAQWIRNPVCHGMVMQKLAFEHLCEETVLKDDSWISKIVKITDMEYPAEEKSGHKWFNKFYQKLIEYKEKYGGFDGVSRDYDIGKYVLGVRQAYKGKNNNKLTQEMIDKLNAIEFPWQVEKVDWFTPFYQKLIEYKEKYGGFAGVTRDKEIGRTVFAVRQAYKGKGAPKLTQEMREQLNLIEFPFELKKSLIHERVVENSKKKKNTFEDEDTFTL